MSSMRDLLEKMSFAGQVAGQKPGDQVRGSEPMPRKGGYKKHPYAGRLVGGAAESKESYCDSCDRIKSKCICDEPTAESLREEFERFVAEYGAPGSGISSIQQGANPQEIVAIKQQQNAQRAEAGAQIKDLQAQLSATRSQMASLNRAFPQGANPVEKAMAMKDMNSQRVQLSRQVEDLTKQITALRRQTM